MTVVQEENEVQRIRKISAKSQGENSQFKRNHDRIEFIVVEIVHI